MLNASRLLALSFLTFATIQANAAEITSAKVSGDSIVIGLRHGGCRTNTYSYKVEMGGCLESLPVQCSAKLTHRLVKGNPGCEAIVHETITVPFAEAGISGDYFAKASLLISGDKKSEASVQLPASIPDVDVAPISEPDTVTARPAKVPMVRCVTHTGSFLSIRDSKVTIETTAGEKATLVVVDVKSLSLESMPPQNQTTYSLEDGRKITTTFVGDATKGRGYFTRLNGQASPTFECVETR